MLCPYCHTENREDRDTCYICGKDLSTIRLVVNKARQHYNDALEHAERGRSAKAIEELQNALDLDRSLTNAHVVLGTLYARDGKFAEARECWETALALQPELKRAHDYLERVESVEVMLPTMRLYRWVAILMFLLALTMAVAVIYLGRQEPGAPALRHANELLAEHQYGEAKEALEQARMAAKPGNPISVSAVALSKALDLDIQQQIRVIQDLKYRQLFPEALDAIAELEKTRPGAETMAVLDNVRGDILYYYHSLIAQLYGSYAQGDLDFDTLYEEITRFIEHYPALPESDEIRTYLARAERLEIESGFDNIRRRFLLDSDVEAAVEGIRDLTREFGSLSSFQQERQAFIEELLSSLFVMVTGFLDQEEFARAAALLNDIQRVTGEFRDVIEVDISGAVDLARSVLRDAQRQSAFRQIEKSIDQEEVDAAEEGIWQMLNEDDLTSAEKNALYGYWVRLHGSGKLETFLENADDGQFLKLQIPDEQASQTLQLYEEFSDVKLPRGQRTRLTGLSALAALKLGQEDQATSLSAQLKNQDRKTTFSQAVNRSVQRRIKESKSVDNGTTATAR